MHFPFVSIHAKELFRKGINQLVELWMVKSQLIYVNLRTKMIILLRQNDTSHSKLAKVIFLQQVNFI